MNTAPLHLNADALTRAVAEHSTKVPLTEAGELWTALTAASLVAPLQDRSPKRASIQVPFGQALVGSPSEGGYGPSPAYMAASKKVSGASTRFLRVFVSLEEELATPRTGKTQMRATGRQLLTATPPGWGMQIVAAGVKHWIMPEDVAREARIAAEEIAREQRGAAQRWGLTVDPDAAESAWVPTPKGLQEPLQRWMDTLGDLGRAEVRILLRQVGDHVEVGAWTQAPENDEVREAAIANTALRSGEGPSDEVGRVLPSPSAELLHTLQLGRERWARPGYGTWLSAMLIVDASDVRDDDPRSITFRHVNSDQLPHFSAGLTAEDLLREQELHPRSAWWMPDWFLAALGLAGALPHDAPNPSLPQLTSGISLEEHLARVQGPLPPLPQPHDDVAPEEPMRLGDFMSLEDELRDIGPDAFLVRHRDDLPRLASEFRRLRADNPDGPIPGLGNLLTTALRTIRDEKQTTFVRELLAAGWPVTTARTGEYNELTILFDVYTPKPSTPERYVELVLLLLRAGCHPTLMDRFGDRPIIHFRTHPFSQQDVAPIYDVVFDRDDLDLGRVASNGSSTLQMIRSMRRSEPDLANRTLTWMTRHGEHMMFLGGDSREPLVL